MIINPTYLLETRVAPEKRKLSPPVSFNFESNLKERLGMKEIWKPVVGYEGHYEVSDQGRVKSVTRQVPHGRGTGTRKIRGMPLNLMVDTGGYRSVGLSLLGFQPPKRVSSLVLEAFKGTRPKGYEASHLDGDKSNDSVDNLIWETHKANCGRRTEHCTEVKGSRNGNSKLTEVKVLKIRNLWAVRDFTMTQLAVRFKVSVATISRILNRKIWTHL